jgi:NADPH:quinone reductase-like Zn-dependent oxidoreductase
MKAVRIHTFGGPEVLQLEEVALPAPGPGEVLVKVRAAGVNPVDRVIRAGYLQQMMPYNLPLVLGLDFAGVVQTVGEGVNGVTVNDDVFGNAPFDRCGAYAQFIAVPATSVAKKPRSLDFNSAAAVPLGAFTAWQGLLSEQQGNLQPGQTVLIHGAAGGVGTFAVQLAKRRGAKVIATCSAANVSYVRGLGADEVIDYAAQPFEKVVHDVDLVFDLIGGDVQQRSWAVLKEGGVLASALGPPQQSDGQGQHARGVAIHGAGNGDLLARIGAMIDAGELKVHVGATTFALADVAKAHRVSESGHGRGRLVLEVSH